MKNIVTFEQRVSRVVSVADIDNELRKAKAYMMDLRKSAEAPNLPKDNKCELQRLASLAEAVTRKIRQHIFDIEDHINAGGTAQTYLQKIAR